MKILTLHLKNYRQHADSEISFGDGITGILGTNGEGKSTIVEAVGWLFFGIRAVRGGKADLRWDRAPARRVAEVEGTFELGGKTYRLWRSESDARLYEGDSATPIAESTSGVDSRMPELLGMELDEFRATYLCEQKELSRIADMKGTARRNFFLQVMGVGKIIDAIAELRERKNELKSERAGLQIGIGERHPLSDELTAAAGQVDALEDELAAVASHEAEARQALGAAGAALTASQAKKDRRDVLTRVLDAAESERASAEQEIMRLFGREKESRDARDRVEAKREVLDALPDLRGRRDNLRTTLAELRRFDDLRAELARLQERRSGAESAAAEIATAEPRLAGLPDLRARRDVLREARTHAKMRGDWATQIEELQRRVDHAREVRADVQHQIDVYDRAEHERVRAELNAAEQKLEGLRTGRNRAGQRAAARRAELATQAGKAVRKIEAITAAGESGACPTCLRELGAAFEAVLETLKEERASLEQEASAEAAKVAAAANPSDDEMSLEVEIEALAGASALLHQRARDAELAESQIARWDRDIDEAEASLRRAQIRLREIPEVQPDPDALAAVERKITDMEELDRSLQAARASAAQLDQLKSDITRLEGEIAGAPTTVVDPDELAMVEAQITELVALDESLAGDRALAAQRPQIFEEIERWQRRQGGALQAKSKAEEDLYLLGFDAEEHASLESATATARVRHQEAATHLARCEEMLRGARERLSRAEAALRDYDARAQQLRLVEQRLLDYEEADTRLSEFRAAEASTIRPEMEELTSAIISLLTDGRFETCTINEDFEVTLQRNGLDRPTISGGEEDIVALAQRIAVSQMIAERAGHPLSLLILDEPFGHLSEARLHNVLGLIRRLKDVFQQVLIISHLREVQDAVDQTVHVTYDEVEGRSRVRALTAEPRRIEAA